MPGWGADLAKRKVTARARSGARPGGNPRAAPGFGRWPAVAGGLLLALVLLTAAGVFALDRRLRQGPFSAEFLVSRIEAAIDRQLAPLSVKIGAAALRYDTANDGKFGVLLTHVAVTSPGGTPVAEIASAGVDLDWTSLIGGTIAPTGLTLIEPNIQVSYAAGKGLLLQTGGNPAAAAGASVSRNAAPADPIGRPQAGQGAGNDARTPNNAIAMLRSIFGGPGSRGAGNAISVVHIRDGTVTVGEPGHDAIWRVPQFDFRLENRPAGGILVGTGNAVAPGGPLHATLSVELAGGDGELRMTAAVDHLVPADLAELNPALLPLAPALLPLSTDASFTFDSGGALSRLDMKVGLGKGHYDVGGACADSFRLDAGGLNIRYVRGTGKVELLPSELANNGSAATVSGLAQVSKDAQGRDRWQYDLQLNNVKLADAAAGLPPVPTDPWNARGTFTPSTGEAVLERLALQAGPARLAMAGRIADTGLNLEAQVEAADPGLVLRLWPACFQSYARNWVLANVQSGKIGKGHMRMALDAAALRQLRATGRAPDDAATAEFSVEDVAFSYADGLPPIIATHGDMTFAGRRFIAQMPDAASQMPSGRVLTLTNARYEVADFLDPSPRGRINLEANGPIETGLEFLNLKPLGLVTASGLRFTDLGGDFSGKVELELPVTRAPQAGDLALKASATLKQLHLKHPVGGYALQGGTVDLEASESALRADGDLLINGVPAKLLWSRPVGAGTGPSPPIRIAATLDANDREQLGLAVNNLLAGDVPVTVDLAAGPDDGSGRLAHVEANLTGAELVLETLAWHKPEGDAATVTFDVAPTDNGRTQLSDFRLVGNKIAISGDIELGPDRKVTAFHFPNFSIDVVTQLDVAGKIRADKVMEVTAKGRFFDGREFFRSLFSPSQLAAKPMPPTKPAPGLDLTADIVTLLGYSQVSMHAVHIHAERQQGQLTALKANATLDGGHKVGVGLEHQPGQPRYLEVDTGDAGRAFRLINLYQGIEGGYAALKVNLDGEGAAEKTGTLWAKHFTLLGDPIVNEVLTEAAAPGGKQSKTPDRPQFDFDKLRVQFSIGQGQLVLRDMFINGPVLGATLHGRIDYGRQTVQLGGTYIPLYGLNSMFGALPIFGPLLVGRTGEGLLGFTFAVDGPLAKPEVLVNPVSGVAPGIFRQIFEIGPEAQGIEHRGTPAPALTTGDAGPDIGEPFPPMTADRAEDTTAPQTR